MDTQSIFSAALGLPEKERILLAEALLESLPPEAEATDDDEACNELERRFTEFQEESSFAAARSQPKGRS